MGRSSPEKQPQEEEVVLSDSVISHEDSLLNTISELDRTFAEDRGEDMGDFFAEDARLMFPQIEDIVGREAIREHFVRFVSRYTTDSWNPKRGLIDVYDQRAYTHGSFIEIRTPLDGGPAEKVYGRFIEIWQLSSKGKWEIIRFMTGRYADTELLD
jgi:ketosteroid isomerase-like protein